MFYICKHITGENDWLEAEDKETALRLAMLYNVSLIGETKDYFAAIAYATENSLDGITFYDENFTKTTLKTIQCSCGAKHTSNPKFHLSYCDLSENENV